MKDFLGQELNKDDLVVYMEVNYRNFRIAKIAKINEKKCTLTTEHGRKTFQEGSQLIKIKKRDYKLKDNQFPEVPLIHITDMKDFRGKILECGDEVCYVKTIVDDQGERREFRSGIIDSSRPVDGCVMIFDITESAVHSVPGDLVVKTTHFLDLCDPGDSVIYIDPDNHILQAGVLDDTDGTIFYVDRLDFDTGELYNHEVSIKQMVSGL